MADQPGVSATDYREKMEHSRYGRSSRSHRRTVKIVMLSIGLAICLLALLVVSIYATVKINGMNDMAQNLQASLEATRTELNNLRPQLEKTQQELSTLVNGRFPNLNELTVNKVLAVKTRYVKNVVFNIIKQANQQQYKYLLVVENNSTEKIRPGFRVLLFDQYGVHVATDEVRDVNDLNPGESRDYASDIEFFFDTAPQHFYIDDLTAQAAE